MGTIKDRFLRRIAQMKASVIAGPQKAGSKVFVRRLITLNEMETKLVNMKSSWVEWFEYDENTRVFSMKTVNTDIIYTWEGVDPKTADKALYGRASCRTADKRKNGPKRWWPNKNPSLGAAFWYILKPFAASAADARAQEMRDYTYLSGEITPKKGRPWTEYERFKKFGRLNFEKQQAERAARGAKI